MESYEITTYSIWLYIRMYRSSELLGKADKLPPMMRYLPDTRSVQKCRCHGEERRGGVQCHWHSSGMKTKKWGYDFTKSACIEEEQKRTQRWALWDTSEESVWSRYGSPPCHLISSLQVRNKPNCCALNAKAHEDEQETLVINSQWSDFYSAPPLLI